MLLNLDDRIRAMDILEWVEEGMEPKKMRVADCGIKSDVRNSQFVRGHFPIRNP